MTFSLTYATKDVGFRK